MTKATIDGLQRAGLAGPFLERKEVGDDPTPENFGEVKTALAALTKANDDWRKGVDESLAEIKAKGGVDPITSAKLVTIEAALAEAKTNLDDLRLKDKRPETTGADGRKRTMTEAEQKHVAAMHAYMRKGDESGYAAIKDTDEFKTLSAGSDPDGGFTIIPELDRNISRVLTEASPIRSIANVMSTSTGVFKRLINVGGTSAGWVGENSSRPQTDTSTLRERAYTAMELYANPAATQTVLDDSFFDLEAWIADEVQIAFAEQEGAAFVMGDGVSKPRGFIGGYTPVANAAFSEAGGAPGYISTGVSGGFLSTADGDEFVNLIDLIGALKVGYRSNARFVMDRTTAAVVRKVRDANGQFYWQNSVQAGQPDVLLGYPVTLAEDMPDMAANSYSVAFGDFNRFYQIVDRMGTRVLRDPFTAKPFVQFYTTKRVGGGIRMAEAAKLLKFI